MNKIYFLMFLLPLNILAQDFSNPKNIVVFALTALTNGNIKALIEVTENSEKRNAQELLTRIESNPSQKDNILSEYKLLKSWTIEDVTHFTNDKRILAVVATRWLVKVPLEKAPKNLVPGDKDAKSETTLYMDYMLENKDNKWKIISRRNL